jgi:hypothetical protein
MAGLATLSDRGDISHRPVIAGAAALFMAALALRYAGAASHTIHQDELYTFFAARSWMRDGTLAIAQGVYPRAAIYSKLTALSLRELGETMLEVRMPAIIAGAITVPALFAFLRRGRGQDAQVAAWVAGALLCFDELHIDTSQMARFYALQALAVFGAAVALYTLMVERPSRNAAVVVWSIAGVGLLWLAMKLQDTTVIAGIGLALFTAGILLRGMLYGSGDRWLTPRRALWLAAGGILLLAVLLALRPVRDMLEAALTQYRAAAPWSEGRDTLFYHGKFVSRFGWLWWLTPAAMVLAWRRSWSLALLGIAMMVAPLGLHSFAGMKHERYVLYVIPFWCLLWGLAVAEIARIARIARMAAERRWAARAVARFLLPGVAVLFLAIVAVSVPDYLGEGAHLWRLTRIGYSENTKVRTGSDRDWTPYLPTLRRVTNVPLLVTSDDLRSLYYLGGFDVMLSYTVQKDYKGAEFARDERTGAPTISSGRSVGLVVRCYPEGVFLIEKHRWRNYFVTPDAADAIQRVATRMPLRPEVPFLAFHWRHGVDASPDCVALRRRVGEKPRPLPRLVHNADA